MRRVLLWVHNGTHVGPDHAAANILAADLPLAGARVP